MAGYIHHSSAQAVIWWCTKEDNFLSKGPVSPMILNPGQKSQLNDFRKLIYHTLSDDGPQIRGMHIVTTLLKVIKSLFYSHFHRYSP